ncbi:DUF2815 family protein [Romboutsia sedimentorum]|uniref:DUF2815 family protein n=1 Tax=Romboutsia sedimentorum TaxID=1368474 RepID=A0ABT7EAI6_9FIRM|nr:DUF2815 family protein [Romboutsia sedimentorum]MDK2563939.1 DUF2815 family protein [Romboutsia sedimentorum]
MKVITGKIRMNYTNLFTPKKLEESDELRYSLSILIPKHDIETIEKINESIFNAKQKGLTIWKEVSDEIKTPLRDGDLEKGDNQIYKNHYFLNATSKYKPGIVDKSLNEVKNQSEIYAGCYGRVSINFYPFYKNGICGIGCGINNVQKISDGDLIITNSRPEDDFSIILDEDILS